MGLAFLYNKQFAKATPYLEYASKISNRSAFTQVDLIRLYTAQGDLVQADAVMEDLKNQIKEGKYVSSCIMSYALGFMGEIDNAMIYLEKAYEEHDAYIYLLNHYPFVPEKLRQDERFQSFINKMAFPE